ncbi:MAG: hypothetical protein ACI9RO_001195 [Alteromonas macleodii]|jgi:hypothetical protein
MANTHLTIMHLNPHTLKIFNPDGSNTPLSNGARAQIASLAARQHNVSGILMQIITFLGGQVEDGLKLLPSNIRIHLNAAATRGLRTSYNVAGRSQCGIGRFIATDRAHMALASMTGALAGLGGLTTTLAELPLSTTVIFHAIQRIAAENGEDPMAAETRAQCLQVFDKGGPGSNDDGIDTSFIGARLGLSGAAVNKLISKVAPKVATVLGQKLATQTVPILGAATGAGTNYAFVCYYTDIAHVHFGLRNLARTFGTSQITDAYTREMIRLKNQ